MILYWPPNRFISIVFRTMGALSSLKINRHNKFSCKTESNIDYHSPTPLQYVGLYFPPNPFFVKINYPFCSFLYKINNGNLIYYSFPNSNLMVGIVFSDAPSMWSIYHKAPFPLCVGRLHYPSPTLYSWGKPFLAKLGYRPCCGP